MVSQLLTAFRPCWQKVRVKIAFAFSVVNIMMSHDDGSGFQRRGLLGGNWGASPGYSKCLFEAMIVSAEEQTANHIPYTAAWMPVNEANKLKILAWAAKHHPHSWVRRFSVYYIAQFGEDEALAASLLKILSMIQLIRYAGGPWTVLQKVFSVSVMGWLVHWQWKR